MQARSSNEMGEGPFELVSQKVGTLPIIGAYLSRLGVEEALEAAIPPDSRATLCWAKALGVILKNLIEGRSTLYDLPRWVAGHDPCSLGLSEEEADAINDDRLGRALDRLYDADRGSLATEIALRAIKVFSINLEALHNDSTAIALQGEYRGADGGVVRGKKSVRITWGHNPWRPDLKQVLWVLTVSEDGSVPIHHLVSDGNTSDAEPHTQVWETLRRLVGRADFLYCADSKLAVRATMDHIDKNGGRFLSVLPRSRKEDGAFRDWVISHGVDWVLVRDNGPTPGGIEDLWAMAEAPWPSAEGYRVVWVSSSAKAARDAEARRATIAATSAKLADLAARLGGPKARIRTIDGAEAAAGKVLGDAARFFKVHLKAITETTLRRIRKQPPGEGASFRPIARTRIECSWSVDDDRVRAEAASDGMFPLITNCRQMPLAEILAHYQWQPCLERQHHHLKSMNVSAMFVKRIARVEALLFLYFIGLLVRSLIEREVRRLMKQEGIVSLPLYPEERDCSSPTAERILASFADICRHGLVAEGTLVQTFEPKLDPLQCKLLKLLGIPATLYDRPGASG